MKYLTLLGIIFTLSSSVSGSEESQMLAGNMHYAQLFKSTTFSERTPGFNDLYMIETPDKGRQIVIYCNPTFCYKLRGHTLTA
jgi:hypothetical protein